MEWMTGMPAATAEGRGRVRGMTAPPREVAVVVAAALVVAPRRRRRAGSGGAGGKKKGGGKKGRWYDGSRVKLPFVVRSCRETCNFWKEGSRVCADGVEGGVVITGGATVRTY